LGNSLLVQAESSLCDPALLLSCCPLFSKAKVELLVLKCSPHLLIGKLCLRHAACLLPCRLLFSKAKVELLVLKCSPHRLVFELGLCDSTRLLPLGGLLTQPESELFRLLAPRCSLFP
jgi:hypothetical protein